MYTVADRNMGAIPRVKKPSRRYLRQIGYGFSKNFDPTKYRPPARSWSYTAPRQMRVTYDFSDMGAAYSAASRRSPEMRTFIAIDKEFNAFTRGEATPANLAKAKEMFAAGLAAWTAIPATERGRDFTQWDYRMKEFAARAAGQEPLASDATSIWPSWMTPLRQAQLDRANKQAATGLPSGVQAEVFYQAFPERRPAAAVVEPQAVAPTGTTVNAILEQAYQIPPQQPQPVQTVSVPATSTTAFTPVDWSSWTPVLAVPTTAATEIPAAAAAIVPEASETVEIAGKTIPKTYLYAGAAAVALWYFMSQGKR